MDYRRVGLPFLVGAQANLLCEVDDSHSYASHTIVIGKARSIAVRDQINPVLYQDGRYSIGVSEGGDGSLR